MVIRTSGIVPEMREAYFKCAVCGAAAAGELERGRVPEPSHCSHCNTAHSFQLIHNRSHFSDKQLVKLQESPGMTVFFLFFFIWGPIIIGHLLTNYLIRTNSLTLMIDWYL